MLLIPAIDLKDGHHQHRARGLAHHAFCGGAQQHVPHEARAPRAQHHQVGLGGIGVALQFGQQGTVGYMHLGCNAVALRHRICQLLQGIARGIEHELLQV